MPQSRRLTFEELLEGRAQISLINEELDPTPLDRAERRWGVAHVIEGERCEERKG